jgi:hypothetical protein
MIGLAAVAVCLVLGLLIAGSVALPRLARQTSDPGSSEDSPRAGDGHMDASAPAAADEPEVEFIERGGDASAPPLDLEEASPEGLKVLSAPAARKAGRRLPALLVVGPARGMFGTLEEAAALAQAGDVIEVRYSGTLLVGSACIRQVKRDSDRPVTLRAGAGLHPVLQPVGPKPMIVASGVDLVISGLHFAGVAAPILSTDSGLAVRQCTLTTCYVLRSAVAPDARLRSIEFERCLVRNAGMTAGSGNASIQFRQCGIVGSQPLVDSDVRSPLSVTLDRCTLCNVYILQFNNLGPELPDHSAAFRMKDCVFGLVSCCPELLLYYMPPSTAQHDQAQLLSHVAATFHSFDAADSVAQFWGMWATLHTADGERIVLTETHFPAMPASPGKLAFSGRIEEARTLIHEKQDAKGGEDRLFSALPSDLVVTTDDPQVQARLQAGNLGVDPALLPVPPTAEMNPVDPAGRILVMEAEANDLYEPPLETPIEPRPLGTMTGWIDGETAVRVLAKKPGDRLTLKPTLPAAGRYQLWIACVRGPECGTIRFRVNDEPMGPEVDLYSPTLSPGPLVRIGAVDLLAGKLELTIECTGKNTAASGHAFDADWIMLRRL